MGTTDESSPVIEQSREGDSVSGTDSDSDSYLEIEDVPSCGKGVDDMTGNAVSRSDTAADSPSVLDNSPITK